MNLRMLVAEKNLVKISNQIKIPTLLEGCAHTSAKSSIYINLNFFLIGFGRISQFLREVDISGSVWD